ncbi:hypothetical protein ABZ341_26335 [Streptomyces sp. NPDC006173]
MDRDDYADLLVGTPD